MLGLGLVMWGLTQVTPLGAAVLFSTLPHRFLLSTAYCTENLCEVCRIFLLIFVFLGFVY